MTPEQIRERIQQVSDSWVTSFTGERDKQMRLDELRARLAELEVRDEYIAALQKEVRWLRAIGDRMLLDIQQHGLDQFGQISALWRAPAQDLPEEPE